jgi:hypothetical protein
MKNKHTSMLVLLPTESNWLQTATAQLSVTGSSGANAP